MPFADAEPIGPLPATKHADTNGASVEVGEPSKCATPSATVWYRITLPTTRTIRVDSIGSDHDTAIAIWRGSSLDHLVPAACDLTIDSQGPDRDDNALVAFTALAHTPYAIQV